MKKVLLFFVLLLSITSKSLAQDTEFWFVAPDIDKGHSDNPVFFVFSNPNLYKDATVNFKLYSNGFDTTFVVNRGSYYKLDFERGHPTRPLSAIENPNATAGIVNNHGIHIRSDVKILAYYMVNSNPQRDIFALKGKPALGKHFITTFQKHDGSHYRQTRAAYAIGADQIDIVATENGTTVDVNLTKDCLNGISGFKYPAGLHSFVLNKGETLKLREDTIGIANRPQPSATHLENINFTKNIGTFAGTVITSNQPIAVTTTEDCIHDRITNPWSGPVDLAGDQIVPTDMVGKRYVVIRGQSTIGERVDFTATVNGAQIKIHYFDTSNNSQILTSPTLNQNETWHIYMDSLPGNASSDIFVDATEPVYCYQHSAVNGELGAAIIPSMYSISQKQIDYFQSPGDVGNYLFLVFRKDCDTTFTIAQNGGSEIPLHIAEPSFLSTVKALPSSITGEWRYAKVRIPSTYDNSMVTIRNSESAFSLGYFNGSVTPNGTASYGYLSGFGGFEFDPDTIWRCKSNPRPVTITGGYAKDYKWTFPDGSILQGPNHTAIRAIQPGMYILEMDQDPRILIDTCWVEDVTFSASIDRIPAAPKPAKVGVPQKFTLNTGGKTITGLNIQWTFQGGNPATATGYTPTVVWNATGPKKVTLNLSVSRGSISNSITCDTTIIMNLDVRPKNNGYFVDQNVSGGLRDGSNWQNAFTTVQEALNLASQGDYIWVAEGEYSPYGDQTYVVDYDSVQIYGGFGGWEANLAERSVGSHPTLLKGSNNSVVTFKGGTTYGNYPGSHPCGLSTETVLDGFIIQDGKAQHGAGILFTNGGTATIANCVIRQNTATVSGGGIYLEAPLCNQASPILTTLEVSGNTAPQGAGMYNDGSDFRATHITVGGNVATTGGGLYNAGGDPIILNSIIWGNRDASAGEIAMDITVSAGTPAYAYSDIGGSNGSGSSWNTALGTDDKKNIDVKPLYRNKGFDEDGTTMVEGNYRLTTSSKPVNEGNNVYVYGGHHLLRDITLLTPTDGDISTQIRADLDGMSRISYDIVDMGAYEFYNEELPPNIKREVLVPEHPYLTTDPEAGAYFVTGHKDFKLTLFPKEGYSLDNLDIKTGSIYQDELGNMEIIRNQDGSVTIIFHEITEPLNIVINGVSPVANELIDSSYALWTENSQLHVKTTKAGTLKVYGQNGSLIKQLEISSGDASVSLQQGFYVVTFNDGLQQKIVVK